MPITKEDKKQIVAEITEGIKATGEKADTASTVVFNYSGATVNELNALKAKLYENKANLKIAKNTLISRALSNYKVSLSEPLQGQNAVLFNDSADIVEPLKTLFEFIKESQKGTITLGVLNNKVLNPDQVEELSKLPSQQELIAKVVGGFASPIRGFAYTLNGVQSKFVYVLNAIKDSK